MQDINNDQKRSQIASLYGDQIQKGGPGSGKHAGGAIKATVTGKTFEHIASDAPVKKKDMGEPEEDHKVAERYKELSADKELSHKDIATSMRRTHGVDSKQLKAALDKHDVAIKKSETTDDVPGKETIEKGGPGSGKYTHHKMMAGYHEAMSKKHMDSAEDKGSSSDPEIKGTAKADWDKASDHEKKSEFHKKEAEKHPKDDSFKTPTEKEALEYGEKHKQPLKKSEDTNLNIIKSHQSTINNNISNIYKK